MMNKRLFTLFTLCVVSLVATASAQFSKLNNDPEVIYLEEYTDQKVELLSVARTDVYGDKKANRHLGVFAADTKLELLAIGKYAYKVKGMATHAGVSGWVNPKLLASKDKNFIKNFRKLYERQIIVRDLLANKDVAIGMTLKEVSQSLGEPTETKVKQTRKGETGEWSYVVTEEQKHYRNVVNHTNGQLYRQLSHVTTEEKSRTTLEFENSVVTTISREKNNGRGRVRIIPTPVVFGF